MLETFLKDSSSFFFGRMMKSVQIFKPHTLANKQIFFYYDSSVGLRGIQIGGQKYGEVTDSSENTTISPDGTIILNKILTNKISSHDAVVAINCDINGSNIDIGFDSDKSKDKPSHINFNPGIHVQLTMISVNDHSSHIDGLGFSINR